MIDIREFLFENDNNFKGIASICTSNYYVIKAAMLFAKESNSPLLLESTCNQVNQFGGYTGMTPYDFTTYIREIAIETNVDFDSIVLGGDHLGPNPFRNINTNEAMSKAEIMVRDYVLAGFKKIHIDCSMRLGDDNPQTKLSNKLIASRTATLLKVSEEAYLELVKSNPNESHPYYIVGSEVPTPGGAQDQHETLVVTKAKDFKDTFISISKELTKHNLHQVLQYIIAFVVQPGVEFSDLKIDEYNRKNASELTNCLKHYKNIVFEGHSTDYQVKENLRMMVEDGIRILKVGPQLTFVLREAFFALSYIEKEIISTNKQSNFIETLTKVMQENPSNYRNHYKDNIEYQIKYSLLDRSRYYLNNPKVEQAIEILLYNLSETETPDSLLSQFLPIQYEEYRNGLITKSPNDLINSKIRNVLENYLFAIR